MPSNNNETTTKFKVDISELKAGITEANRQIKLANAQFKAAASGMESWDKSASGLSAKITNLKTVLSNQEKVLESYEKQLELIKAEYGENSAQADNMRIKIANQQAVVNNTKNSLSQYEKQLEEVSKEQKNSAQSTDKQISSLDKLKGTISKQEAELTKLKQEYANVVLAEGKNSDSAKALASQIDNLSGELRDNKSKLNEAEKAADQFDNSLEDMDDASEKAKEGFTVMKGALASLVADGIRLALREMKELAVQTFRTGADFESSMSKVQAISGASADDIGKLSDKAKSMGETTVFSASQSAEAFNYMAMAGWKTEDMLNGIEGIMYLAAASGEDLATTSDIVTDALTAMGYSAGDAGKLADVMAAASSNANTNVAMMGQTFQYAAPIVGALGYNMEDTAVAIGLMANAGIKGEKAGTALRSILTRLSAPPKECADAMSELGISLTDSEGKMKSLDEIMGDLRKGFSGLSETQQTQMAKSIAGQEAMSGLLAVVNAAPEDFEKLTKAVNNSTGAAKNMADTMTDNVNGQITLLKSNIEGKMIKVFEKASGSIKKAVKSMGQSLDSLDWDKVGNAVGRLAEKFADFVGFVARNTPEIIAVLKTMGAVMISVFAVNKIATFVSSLNTLAPAFVTLATKIGLVTVATEGQTAATLALNTAWLANPITWVIAGLAALTAGVIAYTSYVNKEVEAEYGLSQAQKSNLDSISQLKSSYDSMNESRKSSTDAVNNEFAYIKNLKDEYNGLIDNNGQIKAGYEDRANFILNQLASALGMEVSQIREQIDANGQLSSAIDQVIEKKRAEALLSANQEAYNQAIKDRTEAFNKYIQAQNDVAEAEKNWHEIQGEYNSALDTYNQILTTFGSTAAQKYYTANYMIFASGQKAKESYDMTKLGLESAREAYVGYNNTIQNYEGLSSAIISGDAEKINEAMQNMSFNFKTAENSDRASLEQQVKDMETNYQNMQRAIQKNAPGVTQEMVNQSKTMVDKSKFELKKLEGDATQAGQQAGMNYANGLGSQTGSAEWNAAVVAGSADNAIHNTGDFGGAGSSAGGAYAWGVATKQGDAHSAGQGLGSEANRGANEGGSGSYTSGSFFGEGFFNGIGAWFDRIFNQGKGLALQAVFGLQKGQQEGSPSKLTKKSGAFFGEGYEIGITGTIKDVVKSATNLAVEAYKAIDSETNAFDDLGANAGESFSGGLKSSLEGVKKYISDFTPNEAIASFEQNKKWIASTTQSLKKSLKNEGLSGANTVVNNNYNYVQNNTSPKSLSRLEIYRQTKNQLRFATGGGFSNV